MIGFFLSCFKWSCFNAKLWKSLFFILFCFTRKVFSWIACARDELVFFFFVIHFSGLELFTMKIAPSGFKCFSLGFRILLTSSWILWCLKLLLDHAISILKRSHNRFWSFHTTTLFECSLCECLVFDKRHGLDKFVFVIRDIRSTFLNLQSKDHGLSQGGPKISPMTIQIVTG